MKAYLILVFTLLLLIPWQVSAQKLAGDFSAGASYHTSVFFPSERTAHLFQAIPVGFEIEYLRQTKGEKAWERTYRLPSWGIAFSYYDYRNPVLGKMYGLTSVFNYKLFKSRRANFLLNGGLGLAYTPTDHDVVDNPTNHAIGNPFSFIIAVGTGATIRLSGRIDLKPQLKAVHFSNGGLAEPNLGLNLLQANLGINYRFFHPISTSYKEEQKTIHPPVRPVQLYVYADLAGKAVRPFGSFPDAVYSLSIQIQKRLSTFSRLRVGVEGFAGPALKKDIEYYLYMHRDEEESLQIHESRLLGLTAGHELLIGNVGILAQLGYYLREPSPNISTRFYQRSGIQYYWNDKKYCLGLTVKTHGYGNSHSLGFGAGARIL